MRHLPFAKMSDVGSFLGQSYQRIYKIIFTVCYNIQPVISRFMYSAVFVCVSSQLSLRAEPIRVFESKYDKPYFAWRSFLKTIPLFYHNS